MASRVLRISLAFAAVLVLVSCDRVHPTDKPIAGDPAYSPAQVSAAALQQANLDERTRAFYQARNWRPAWDGQAAARMQAALRDLARHGIDPSRISVLPSANAPVAREIALTRAALAYGDALAHGLIDPTKVFAIFDLERNDLDVDTSLNAALSGRYLQAWIDGLPPNDAEYKALSDAYLSYVKLAAQPQPPPIPSGKPIKPGGHDPRLPQIAQTLTANDYYAATEPAADPTVYAPDLVAAVKRFQGQEGVNDDGVLGDDTIALLNAGPMDRARQIALNLENRRWLKRDPPATRIDVNTAATILDYYRDGQIVDSRRTVAGKPGTETPNLAGPFSRLVVNPPWNVPQEIAEKEILPKGQAYLTAEDMYVDDGRVVQRPGPKAALGQVKFDMQDQYAIYLHDTPSKAAFQANERHGSHGCVRVEDALGFARILAQDAGKLAEFETQLASGQTATVSLGRQVPVRLMYHTVFLDKDGRLTFRPDVYGWDEMLATALNMPPPLKRVIGPEGAGDIGP